jgi:hypothetical protein
MAWELYDIDGDQIIYNRGDHYTLIYRAHTRYPWELYHFEHTIAITELKLTNDQAYIWANEMINGMERTKRLIGVAMETVFGEIT